jgi:hypothetical protein
MEEEVLLERQHEEEAMLGDGGVVDTRREQERDPHLGAAGDVDLVDADAVLGEDLEPGGGSSEHLPRDRVIAAEIAVDLADSRDGVGLGKRTAGGDDFPTGGGERRMVGAGGVLEGRGRDEDPGGHREVPGARGEGMRALIPDRTAKGKPGRRCSQ